MNFSRVSETKISNCFKPLKSLFFFLGKNSFWLVQIICIVLLGYQAYDKGIEAINPMSLIHTITSDGVHQMLKDPEIQKNFNTIRDQVDRAGMLSTRKTLE